MNALVSTFTYPKTLVVLAWAALMAGSARLGYKVTAKLHRGDIEEAYSKAYDQIWDLEDRAHTH